MMQLTTQKTTESSLSDGKNLVVLASVVYALVTCETKLFQNYLRGLLQLMNIFRHILVAEIILE